MNARHIVLVAFAAAVTLTSAGAAGPAAPKQLVWITSKGVVYSPGKFELTPQQAGPVRPDSGTETAVGSLRDVVREGQRVSISDWVYTLKGKRGNLVIRARIEYVQAGNRYHVGIGTWEVVRGTDQYAQITGGGRLGSVWLDVGPFSERRVGFLTLP